MALQVPQNLASTLKSEREAWTTELGVLSRDPTVRKFLDLQERIRGADDFLSEVAAPALSARSWPFDPYDALEFARDLFGQEVSTLSLSKFAYARFPGLSNEGRQLMMRLVVDNGYAEVTRRTDSGRPTWYRFAAPANGGAEKGDARQGVPASELSGFKVRDLEDIVALRMGEEAQP